MEHDCIKFVTCVVLNVQFLGSMAEAQKMREERKGWREGERDRKDREKNRLTSLHLIGSSCNHKKNKPNDR